MAKQVENRIAERPDRGERLVNVAEVAAVADGHRADLLPVPLGRDERRRRRVSQDEPDGQLTGRLGGQRPVGAQDLLRALERPGDEAPVHGRADLVETERERRDDPEVRARASDRPVEVGVLVPTRTTDQAVGGDDLGLQQVVDRPPEAPGEVAETTAERQSRHADFGDEPQRHGQAEALRLAVDLAQETSGLDRRGPCLRVDDDPAKPRHVDGHATVHQRRARDVVTAAPNGDREAAAAGEVHRGHDVGGVGGLDDGGGGLRDRAVPQACRLRERRIALGEQRAPQARAKRRNGLVGRRAHAPPPSVSWAGRPPCRSLQSAAGEEPALRCNHSTVRVGPVGGSAYLPHEAMLVREGRRSRTGGHTQLLQDVAHVAVHGPLADNQLGCDRLVRLARGDQAQHL